MPTRTARTAWTGTLQDGSGRTELASSGLGTFDVSWPKRTSDQADGSTSPEELIAAAHASCYAMAFSGGIAKAGGTPQSLDVTADVGFGPDKDRGGFMITGIKLTVRGRVDGLDAAGFEKAAQEAKAGCPVSKALAGVDITLDAALDVADLNLRRRIRRPAAPVSGRRAVASSADRRGRPRRCSRCSPLRVLSAISRMNRIATTATTATTAETRKIRPVASP